MFFSALLIGFLGSLHCVVMCSPITLMLGKSKNRSQFIFQRLIYNLGRVAGYGVLGIIAGVFGKLLNIAGIQQWFSIGIGIAIILVIVTLGSRKFYNPTFKPLVKVVTFLRMKFSSIYQSEMKFKGLFIGLLNGFLPCGLVYMALLGAITMETIGEALLYMIIFGFGTWPMMLLISFSGGWIYKMKSKMVLQVVPFLIAILFIVRGLGLGIPYLSPVFEKSSDSSSITDCINVK